MPFLCKFGVGMIGKTPIELHLQKAIALSDALAWFDANTHWLQKTIIKMIKFDQNRAWSSGGLS